MGKKFIGFLCLLALVCGLYRIFEATLFYSMLGFVFSVGYVLLVVFSGKMNISGKNKVLLISGCLFLTIFFWRLAILRNTALTVDLLVQSMLESFRTFNMDANYSNFVYNTRALVYGSPYASYFVNSVATYYFPCLYFLAPITGAVAILEIISSVASRFKLSLYSLLIFKEFVYFSELNEQSLALANSIVKDSKRKLFLKPLLIFTDVYIDREEEKSSELLLSAKKLGAVCISDDILHVHIPKSHKKKIFLIDNNEGSNIQTFSAFSEDDKCKLLENTQMFVFSNEEDYTMVCNNVKQEIEERKWKNPPRILTVNGYKNIVKNLFRDIPLYEPVIGNNEKGDKQLNITIVGAGEIGTELFLSAYWYGQILGYKLYINVISQQKEEAFYDKINMVNSEIFSTGVRIKPKTDSCKLLDDLFINDGKKSDFEKIMRVYSAKPDSIAEPYFYFRYKQLDVENSLFNEKIDEELWEDNFKLTDTDYFAVALGTDKGNLKVADNIKNGIAVSRLGQEKKKNTVISYVVYDSYLCRSLNKKTDEALKNHHIYMYAFGSFDEVFDIKNIYMKREENSRKNIRDSYEKIEYDIAVEKYEKTRKQETQYEFWADNARSLHIRYKVFSAGYIKSSVFNCDSISVRDERNEAALFEYRREIIPCLADKEEIKLKKKKEKIYLDLIWLEHRRWCAFMRINGFTSVMDFTKYSSYSRSHKEMKLKLHACLVESDATEVISNLYSYRTRLDLLDGIDSLSLKIFEDKYKKSNEAAIGKMTEKEAIKHKQILDMLDELKKAEDMLKNTSDDAEKVKLEKTVSELEEKINRNVPNYKMYDEPGFSFADNDDGELYGTKKKSNYKKIG